MGTWTYVVVYGGGVVRYEKQRSKAYAFAKAYAEKLKAQAGQPRG